MWLVIFYHGQRDLNPSECNTPVGCCCHQCKHWWLPLFSPKAKMHIESLILHYLIDRRAGTSAHTGAKKCTVDTFSARGRIHRSSTAVRRIAGDDQFSLDRDNQYPNADGDYFSACHREGLRSKKTFLPAMLMGIPCQMISSPSR